MADQYEKRASARRQALLALLSGTVAEPAAGLAGLYGLVTGGAAKGAHNVEATREALTYHPRDASALEAVGRAVEPVTGRLQKLRDYLGDKTLAHTGSPALATAGYMVPDTLLTLLGARGALAGKSAEAAAPHILPYEQMEGAPVGSWVHGPRIPGVDPAETRRVIADVPLSQIDATEFDSAGRIVADKHADAMRYAEAMRRGDVFPNARGAKLASGKIKLQDGHRRLAAAMEVGAPSLRIAVLP